MSGFLGNSPLLILENITDVTPSVEPSINAPSLSFLQSDGELIPAEPNVNAPSLSMVQSDLESIPVEPYINAPSLSLQMDGKFGYIIDLQTKIMLKSV